MEHKECRDCKYFYQHYVRCGRGYTETYWGHCVSPRVKPKRSQAPACERFQEREAEENALPV